MVNKSKTETFDCQNELKKYGKVIEEEDKIVVYVKQKIIYKYNNKVLPCHGLNNGKKIYYVFDKIIFADKTCISGQNANLIFTDCTFNQIIKIFKANNVEMRNNKYAFYTGLIDNSIEIAADKILIKNNNIVNLSPFKKFDEPLVNMTLVGDQINIDNSIIRIDFGGHINILAHDLSINESTINGPKIYLTADDISTKKSAIVASDGVKIDNSNCNFTCAIKSPVTIYNDIRLDSLNSKIIDIDEEKIELLKSRLKLINILHKIELDCIKQNSEELAEIRNKIRNRKISKILKK